MATPAWMFTPDAMRTAENAGEASAPMLNDFTGADQVYIACGYTDLRKGIDGLARHQLLAPKGHSQVVIFARPEHIFFTLSYTLRFSLLFHHIFLLFFWDNIP